MNGYAIALFVHLLCVLLACAAASLATLAALRLRDAATVADATPWLALVRRVVPAFPLAVLGLLASGGYMTHTEWRWSIPWIDAALVGLALIVALGNGVEATRLRALEREITSEGMSPRARRLARDPLFWTAKTSTLTLLVAVVFIMTVKPAGVESAVVLAAAVLAGALAAVPFWRGPVLEAAPTPAGHATS